GKENFEGRVPRAAVALETIGSDSFSAGLWRQSLQDSRLSETNLKAKIPSNPLLANYFHRHLRPNLKISPLVEGHTISPRPRFTAISCRPIIFFEFLFQKQRPAPHGLFKVNQSKHGEIKGSARLKNESPGSLTQPSTGSAHNM